MAKKFDSLEDMDKWALEVRLMKTQMKVLKEQTRFNKILALTTAILAFTALLSFINKDLTRLLFVGGEFSFIGLIVSILFSGLFIWLLVEIINEIIMVKRAEKS